MALLAHGGDLHLDGGKRAAERAGRVMAYLDSLTAPLDALLVTGDIADHGLPDEYAQARALLDARHRVLTCPGNHDARAPYRRHLLGEPASHAPINSAHDLGPVLAAVCDSSIPGRDDGCLDEATLAWLGEVLDSAATDQRVLVAFHHPPVVLHSPFVDAIRQHGERRLADLLARHPQVAAVLCGHAHTPAASTFAGRPLLVAPGVVSTLRLPWEGCGDIDKGLPPAVAFHVLDDHGRLTTHYRLVP